MLGKRKRNESNGSSAPEALTLIQQKLDAAEAKIAEHDKENARRDDEQRAAQAQIAEMAKLITYMKSSDPNYAAYLKQQALTPNAPTPDPTLTPGTAPLIAPSTAEPSEHRTKQP